MAPVLPLQGEGEDGWATFPRASRWGSREPHEWKPGGIPDASTLDSSARGRIQSRPPSISGWDRIWLSAPQPDVGVVNATHRCTALTSRRCSVRQHWTPNSGMVRQRSATSAEMSGPNQPGDRRRSAASPVRKEKMHTDFKFLDPGRLVDGDLELILAKKVPANPAKKHAPYYLFEMRRAGGGPKIGRVSFRVDSARRLRCPGHLGYRVNKRYRGRQYAARSCRLLFSLARAHGLKALWITCDPKNMASRRTCELVGARYRETVRVPTEHEMYRQGARHVRRYRIGLNKALSNPPA